jgi:hypothetical protein
MRDLAIEHELAYLFGKVGHQRHFDFFLGDTSVESNEIKITPVQCRAPGAQL